MSRLSIVLLLVFGISGLSAQTVNRAAVMDKSAVMGLASVDPSPALATPPIPAPNFISTVALPRMSPELALSAYYQCASRQAQALGGYSAASLIRVELPDNAQRGEFELERHYIAPHTLTFKALRFVGDAFVKTNVIARLLQSEVDHVQKDDPALTALRPENYKFSYKGVIQEGDRTLHMYQVKPRKKRVGLFKVARGGQAVDLTVREFELLEYLLRHHGQVVLRDTLAREVWKETTRGTPLNNVIDVHIARLRRKIDLDQPVKQRRRIVVSDGASNAIVA